MSVLYVKPSNSSFVKIDQEILEKSFATVTYNLKMNSPIRFLLSLTGMVFYALIFSYKYKIIFTRFADYYSGILAFLAKILRKKLVIVVGGYDVYYLPDQNYGAYSKKWRGKFTRYALNNAYALLPNSSALIYEKNTYASDIPIEAGIKFYAPNTKAIIKQIHNGFKTEKWNIDNTIQKESLVLTIAMVDDMITYKIKGIEHYIATAHLLSHVNFTIVGISNSFINNNNINIPSNLTVIEKLPHNELLDYYLKSKVFCLFSLTEGMPNVLCEAMLCKCIPVVSNVSIMPEIVGESGYIVNKRDINEMASKIELALASGNDKAEAARNRIIENYSFERRENELTGFIKSILT
jgi:glycosyltransferase involved in cell wall biosynthesis